MTHPESRKPRPMNMPVKRQGGFALLLGLLLVLVITVLGVFALNGSIMQERMAGNSRDYSVAFEASEIALRWGEAWLQSRAPKDRPFPCQTLMDDKANQNCTDPRQILESNLLGHDLEDRDPWKEYANAGGGGYWDSTNARPYGIDPATNKETSPKHEIPLVAEQPLFLMEQAYIDRDDLAGRPQQGRIFYRIHVAATGHRATTVVVGGSSVAKRYE